MSVPVKILKYNPKYPEEFDKEKELILNVFNDPTVYVEHIGSTAVPGLGGKPIIDVMVGIDSLKEADKYIELLKTIDYTFDSKWKDDFPERRALDKRLNNFGIHLYIVEFNTGYWVRHILIRDYLRDYPKVVEEYNKLKTDLAKKFQHDREAYTKGKSKFIEKVAKKAKKKYKSFTT